MCKQTEAQKYIDSKRPETKEGRETLEDARKLSYQYPNLSGPELIRLAYWGASGTSP